jgi:hypothetical protein
MRVILFNAHTGSSSIGFTRKQSHGRQQPIYASRAQKVVRSSQGKVLGYVAATQFASASFTFSQCKCPCFVQFAHDSRIKVKRRKGKGRGEAFRIAALSNYHLSQAVLI